MTQESRANYWIKRFKETSTQLPDAKKLELIKTTLAYFVGLGAQEVDIFIDPNLKTDPSSIDNTLRYVSAEKKVSDAYSTSDEPEDRIGRAPAYEQKLREELTDVYTLAELDEIFSPQLMGESTDERPGNFSLVTKLIVGWDHYVIRRIRNAYLPAITNLYTINGENITHTLFDGQSDAVGQIEDFMRR